MKVNVGSVIEFINEDNYSIDVGPGMKCHVLYLKARLLTKCVSTKVTADNIHTALIREDKSLFNASKLLW